MKQNDHDLLHDPERWPNRPTSQPPPMIDPLFLRQNGLTVAEFFRGEFAWHLARADEGSSSKWELVTANELGCAEPALVDNRIVWLPTVSAVRGKPLPLDPGEQDIGKLAVFFSRAAKMGGR
jgi:hypothetical protein